MRMPIRRSRGLLVMHTAVRSRHAGVRVRAVQAHAERGDAQRELEDHRDDGSRPEEVPPVPHLQLADSSATARRARGSSRAAATCASAQAGASAWPDDPRPLMWPSSPDMAAVPPSHPQEPQDEADDRGDPQPWRRHADSNELAGLTVDVHAEGRRDLPEAEHRECDVDGGGEECPEEAGDELREDAHPRKTLSRATRSTPSAARGSADDPIKSRNSLASAPMAPGAARPSLPLSCDSDPLQCS